MKMVVMCFLEEIQSSCVDKIYNGGYRLKLKYGNNLCTNAHPCGSIEHLCQDLLIRKLSVNIMHSYKLKSMNRNLIVRQLT